MKVYVGQYGFFWSLTYPQWIEVCRNGAQGHCYDLDEYKCLSR